MLSVVMLSVVAPTNKLVQFVSTASHQPMDFTSCFVRAVSYTRNMFMKSITGACTIKLFTVVITLAYYEKP
jgi:hypothetical protein